MARSFNGGTDVVAAGSVVNGQNNISFSLWAYPTAVGPGAMVGSVINAGPELRIDAARTVTLLSQNTAAIATSTGTLTLNAWVQVGFTQDTLGTARIYINGAVDGSAAGTPFQANTNLDFGNAGNGEAFAGQLADIAIWKNATLTAAEMGAMAKGARPGSIRPTLLYLWLPLTGISSPEPDLSGGANNGTVTGTANAFGPPLMPFTPRWHHYNGLMLPTAGLSWIINRRNKLASNAR